MTDADQRPASEAATDEHREFDTETVPPEKQPEFVGVHSAVDDPHCRNWVEPHPDGDCGQPATHTVVRYAGSLLEIPMCDDCGYPERVADWNREWSADRERASGDTLVGDGGLPEHVGRINGLGDGLHWYRCQECGATGATLDAIDHHQRCPGEHEMVADGGHPEKTHLDDDGLWIPPAFRGDRQLIIRTPRATIQHWGSLDRAYYGMVDESHFGDVDGMRDPRNPDLAPDSVGLTLVDEPAAELAVDTSALDGDSA